MANYAYTSLGISQTTIEDATNEDTIFQYQANFYPFQLSPSNPIINSDITTPAEFSIFNETQPGFLTGRRPQVGQLYPRGVYNK